MGSITSESLTQIIGGLFVSLAAIAIGLQKLVKNWKQTDAETSIVALMHQELERLAKQNTTLAIELNKLQLEIVTLNTQLNSLTVENQRLHNEIVLLSTEITSLQYTLAQRNLNDNTN